MRRLIWLITVIIILSCTPKDFTDNQIRDVEKNIKDEFINKFSHSASEIERQEMLDGKITIEVQMIKVAERKLDGFVKIHYDTEQARKFGLDEITIPCEATRDVDSSKYIWRCGK